jgi:hypothetical protein
MARTRRDVLAMLVGAGSATLGGCERLLGPDRTRSTEQSGTRTGPSTATSSAETGQPTDRTDDYRRRIRLVDQTGILPEHQLDVTAEVVRADVTPAETAKLRITTTNLGPRREISVTEGQCAILNRHDRGSDPAGLWLNDPNAWPPEGDRWVADRPADDERVFFSHGCGSRTYDTGESVSTEYALWHDYRVPGYFAPGTYRWSAVIDLNPSSERPESRRLDAVPWEFALAVTRPE